MPLPITAILKLTQNAATELDLSGLQLGDNEARFLANLLGANESVKKLNLTNNNIGPVGAKELAIALERYNRTLEALDITGNPIGAEGAAELARVAKDHKSLQTLRMDHYAEPEKTPAHPEKFPSVKELAKHYGQTLHASDVTISGAAAKHMPIAERVVNKAVQGR